MSGGKTSVILAEPEAGQRRAANTDLPVRRLLLGEKNVKICLLALPRRVVHVKAVRRHHGVAGVRNLNDRIEGSVGDYLRKDEDRSPLIHRDVSPCACRHASQSHRKSAEAREKSVPLHRSHCPPPFQSTDLPALSF